MSFVHLRLHTEFSVRDSLVRMDVERVTATPDGKIDKKHVCPPVEFAQKDKMPALSISDTNNIFGAIRFYKAARNSGVQPIISCDIRVKREAVEPPFRVLVVAKNNEGYRELCEMLTAAYKKTPDPEKVYVDMDWFKIYNKGLFVLSGAMDGDVGLSIDEGRLDEAKKQAEEWKAIFGNRYLIEVQRYGRPGESDYISKSVQIADELDIPLVATHPIQFMKKEDYRFHEVRTSIQEKFLLTDPVRPRIYSDEQYFKSTAEMEDLFKDIPDALENAVKVAEQCSLEITLGKPQLPKFPVPEGMTEKEYMAVLSRERLEQRLEYLYPEETKRNEVRQRYQDRLEFEIATINQMGFDGYFLIVADFINWGKKNGVPVGPGRGSGAGSLVAYCLGITDIDPLPYDLLFERFLNPERVSMPDFDVDFCEDTRYKVIQYVIDTYGIGSVAQIATFGSGAAKGVIKDASRVLGFSYGFGESISNMVPHGPKVLLRDAMDANPDIAVRRENDEDVELVFEYAEELEKIVRNVGKHAGGVLIAPGQITEFCPLYAQDENGFVSQYDKDDVEAAGLVKFDFLGLKTLTVIQRAVNNIKETHGIELDPLKFNLEDDAVWTLMKKANTTAVFQVESKGMKGLLTKLQPDNFEDLIALVALFRPGPLQSGMVDDFIKRKHGKADVDYMTNLLDIVRESTKEPDYAGNKKDWTDDQWKTWRNEQKTKIITALEPILAPTYGVIVYQEQVMQIAQAISGYTLGGADMLRRAMGKKKPEEMAKQRSTFESGAATQGVDPEFAGKLFDLIAMFAEYGFNKSHSAAYALITYQTGYLKTHYPVEFMAAAMSSEDGNTDQLKIYIDDARKNGITVLNVDINRSESDFKPEQGAIRYGLSAVKSVGENAHANIVSARKEHGEYINLEDFIFKTNRRLINSRATENLVKAGAFDALDSDRPKLLTHVSPLREFKKKIDETRIKVAKQVPKVKKPVKKSKKEEQAELMTDMFSAPAAPVAEPPEPTVDERVEAAVAAIARPELSAKEKAWTLQELLDKEKECLGMHFSHHPFEVYSEQLKNFNSTPLGQIAPSEVNLVVCGIVSSLFKKLDKEGREMSFVQLDDGFDKQDVLFFHDAWAGHRHMVVEGNFLAVEVAVRKNEKYDRPSILAQRAYTFDLAKTEFSRDGNFTYDGPLPFGMSEDTPLEDILKDIQAQDMTFDPEEEPEIGDGSEATFNVR